MSFSRQNISARIVRATENLALIENTEDDTDEKSRKIISNILKINEQSHTSTISNYEKSKTVAKIAYEISDPNESH